MALMAMRLVPGFEEVRFGSVVPIELSATLAANDFFYGVDGALVRECATMSRITWLPAGTLLHGDNRRSSCVFLILYGAVEIEYCRFGESAVSEALRAGTFTGEASLLGIERFHRVTARCVEPTLLCWVRAADLMALLDREPQIALNVARALHARLLTALAALDGLPVYVDKP